MDSLINSIKEKWLQKGSLPFVFAVLLMLYVGLASEMNDWTGIVMTSMGYLLLAVPFVIAFVVYFIWCLLHDREERKAIAAKKAQEQEEGMQEEETQEQKEEAKKKDKKDLAWLVAGLCLSVVAVIVAVIFFFSGNARRDGNYVIWAQEHHVSLSPEVTHSYYLVGDPVQAKGAELSDYTARSVVKLDFDKDGTFTICYNGALLGTVPGYNGVGYREECTQTRWVLEEVGDDVYYIRNAEDESYLKWYEEKTNWTTHPEVDDNGRDQYFIRLERVN